MADEAWARARTLAERQRWLLTAEQARAAGLLPSQVSGQIRSGAWLPLLRGVYLIDADMFEQLPVQMWWRAALLAHGPDGCLVGRAGARANGCQGLPIEDSEIDVAVIGGVPRASRAMVLSGTPVDGPLVVVRQWPVREDEVVKVDGLRARNPGLSVVDAALSVDRVHALCLFDWALRTGVHTPDTLHLAVARARRRPGVVHAREAAALADGRAASPLESRVRLACIDGEVAPDDLQYVVRDRWAVVVAIGDLAWLRNRTRPLIAEADGKGPHNLPTAVYHDRRRGNALVIQCCDTVRFTWSDSLRPIYVQQVVRSALAA